MTNKRALITFGKQTLQDQNIPIALLSQMFSYLPKDTKVVGFDSDLFSDTCVIIFHSDQFEATPLGHELPKIIAIFTKDDIGNEECVGLDMSMALQTQHQQIDQLTEYSDVLKKNPTKALTDTGIRWIEPQCDCGTKMSAHHINCPAHSTNRS